MEPVGIPRCFTGVFVLYSTYWSFVLVFTPEAYFNNSRGTLHVLLLTDVKHRVQWWHRLSPRQTPVQIMMLFSRACGVWGAVGPAWIPQNPSAPWPQRIDKVEKCQIFLKDLFCKKLPNSEEKRSYKIISLHCTSVMLFLLNRYSPNMHKCCPQNQLLHLKDTRALLL